MLECKDAFYGGAARGGKSVALLMAALQYVDMPGYNAILIRDSYTNLSKPGALMPMADEWLSGTDAHWHGELKQWEFPTGGKPATLSFGYLDGPRDHYHHKSSDYQFEGIDEAVSIREEQALYMFTRLTRTKEQEQMGIPLRFRCASNPPARLEVARGAWVKTRYVDSETRRKGAIFIPARLQDNPHEDQYHYEHESLSEVDPITRAQLLEGDWNVRATGHMFKRHWFEVVDAAPTNNIKVIRYWDMAATEDAGAFTSGCKISMTPDGLFFIESMIREQLSPRHCEALVRQTADMDGKGVPIWMEQEPGSPIWEEEPILMGDGTYKPLKQIVIGDQVITKQGTASKVNEIHIQGDLDSLKICTNSGRCVITATTHPFLTTRGWVEAGCLTGNDILALGIPKIKEENCRSFEEFRLAGYFIGDGCCTKTGNSINARITCTDEIQGKDIIHCTESLSFGCTVPTMPNADYSCSNGIREWLYDVELAEKRTENKVAPSWVFKASNQQVANFIGAYFACDGTVSIGGGKDNIEFYSISKELLQGIQHLLIRFGIKSRLAQRRYNPVFQSSRQIIYRLQLRMSDDSQPRFAEQIPVYGRKAIKLSSLIRQDFDKDFLTDKIELIEPVGLYPCRCLTIAGEHSFLVNDLVVHNSGVAIIDHYRRNILRGFAFRGDKVDKAKTQRAGPFASQAEGGNVFLVNGAWVPDFLDEIELYPDGPFLDQVDSAGGAFNKLVGIGAGVTPRISLVDSSQKAPLVGEKPEGECIEVWEGDKLLGYEKITPAPVPVSGEPGWLGFSGELGQ